MSSVQSRRGAASEVASRAPWFHNLHLPDGTQTAPEHPLGDFPSNKWDKIAPCLPEDLSGWQVLDIGCNAGFYTFELARRGAYVTAIDVDRHYLDQARWAAGEFGLADRVEFHQMQVYDLARWKKTYDLVWFMGVFYHLRYPLLALDIVSRVTRRLLMFQTMTMPGSESGDVPHDLALDERQALRAPHWPKMAFIEHRLADDPTNWWAPDDACVEAMLRSSGFSIKERPAHEVYFCVAEPHDHLRIGHLKESEYRAAIQQPWQQT